jgi:hypothetical protein
LEALEAEKSAADKRRKRLPQRMDTKPESLATSSGNLVPLPAAKAGLGRYSPCWI